MHKAVAQYFHASAGINTPSNSLGEPKGRSRRKAKTEVHISPKLPSEEKDLDVLRMYYKAMWHWQQAEMWETMQVRIAMVFAKSSHHPHASFCVLVLVRISPKLLLVMP